MVSINNSSCRSYIISYSMPNYFIYTNCIISYLSKKYAIKK